MIVKKRKRYDNFIKGSQNEESLSQTPIKSSSSNYKDTLRVIPRQIEIKNLLKRLQKDIESFPDDSKIDRFKAIKECIEFLDKYSKEESIVEFSLYTIIRELQFIQKNPRYMLSHKMYLAQKGFELIQKINWQKLRSVIEILVELIGIESDTKIRIMLIKSLIRSYKRYNDMNTDEELDQILLQKFSLLSASELIDVNLQKKILNLLYLLVKRHPKKLEALANLLVKTIYNEPRLIEVYINILLKIDFTSLSQEALQNWIETILQAINENPKEVETSHLEIIDLFCKYIQADQSQNGIKIDIFSYICEKTRHFDRKIRKSASGALGQIMNIPESTILSTLKKEELDHYKKKRKTKRDELTTTDIYIGTENSKDIIQNRVTGTFIFLLEDELAEIRIEAISSIRKLSKKFQEFAKDAKQILLNMLHDENDQVRALALEAAADVMKEIKIGDFERDVLLFNLKEDVFFLRVSIYKLFSIVKLTDKKTLELIIKALMENIEVYPIDKSFIFKSLSAMIINNKELSKSYVQTFLQTEEKYLVQEPDWKWPTHIAKIVILATVEEFDDKIIRTYPFYYKKHLAYLKDAHPDYFTSQRQTNPDSHQINLDLFKEYKNAIDIEETILKEITASVNEQQETEKNLQILRKLRESLRLFPITDKTEIIQDFITILMPYYDILITLKNSFSVMGVFDKIDDNSIYQVFLQIIRIEESHQVGNDLNDLLRTLKEFFLLSCLAKLLNKGCFEDIFQQKKILEMCLLLSSKFTNINELRFIEDFIKYPQKILQRECLNSALQSLVEKLLAFKLPHIKTIQSSSKKQKINFQEPNNNLESCMEANSQLFILIPVIIDLVNINELDDICLNVVSNDNDICVFKLDDKDVIIRENTDGQIKKVRTNLTLNYEYWNRASKITIFASSLLSSTNTNLINFLQNNAFDSIIKSSKNEKFRVLSDKIEILIKPVK